MDTFGVRGETFILIAVWLAGAACGLAQDAASWAGAVGRGGRMAPEARIVVVDEASGRVLAARHLDEAARTLAAPGSTLKPLVLYGLVSGGRWDPGRRVACTRKLRVVGRELNCSHPAAGPMDAREALTWSCNSYFAAVGATLRAGELRGLLAPTGLLGETGLAAGEATAAMREPKSVDEERLAVLGVEGVRVTPLGWRRLIVGWDCSWRRMGGLRRRGWCGRGWRIRRALEWLGRLGWEGCRWRGRLGRLARRGEDRRMDGLRGLLRQMGRGW